MPSRDFRIQDIYKDKQALVFNGPNAKYRNYLVEFKPQDYTDESSEIAKPVRLYYNILFQIVGIRDVTVSTIELIDTLTELIDVNASFTDMQRSRLKERHVIRSVNVSQDDNSSEQINKDTGYGCVHGNLNRRVFKLTLQDSNGNLCYGFETEPLKFLRTNEGLYPVALGSKLIVKGGLTTTLFNCIQLTNINTQFLGGDIPRMNYKLFEKELKRLKDEIGYGK